jgi:hypothetical protein
MSRSQNRRELSCGRMVGGAIGIEIPEFKFDRISGSAYDSRKFTVLSLDNLSIQAYLYR